MCLILICFENVLQMSYKVDCNESEDCNNLNAPRAICNLSPRPPARRVGIGYRHVGEKRELNEQ